MLPNIAFSVMLESTYERLSTKHAPTDTHCLSMLEPNYSAEYGTKQARLLFVIFFRRAQIVKDGFSPIHRKFVLDNYVMNVILNNFNIVQ